MNANQLSSLVEVMQTSGEVPAEVVLGDVLIDTNHGRYVLKDAVWTPYTVNGTYNTDGLNGSVKGLVVQGGDTNRLFWATSFTDYAGTVKEFGYCYLPKARANASYNDDHRVYFNLQFCG
jgi:hypothetical protein